MRAPGEKGTATADTRRAGKELWMRNPAAGALGMAGFDIPEGFGSTACRQAPLRAAHARPVPLQGAQHARAAEMTGRTCTPQPRHTYRAGFAQWRPSRRWVRQPYGQ
jgi:hypothetical protein